MRDGPPVERGEGEGNADETGASSFSVPQKDMDQRWGGGKERMCSDWDLLNWRMAETSKWRCTANSRVRRPTGLGDEESASHVPADSDAAFCFQYFVFTGVLAMVTCAVFLRLNSVLKLAVLLIMIAIYALLTETVYAGLFLRYDHLNHSGE